MPDLSGSGPSGAFPVWTLSRQVHPQAEKSLVSEPGGGAQLGDTFDDHLGAELEKQVRSSPEVVVPGDPEVNAQGGVETAPPSGLVPEGLRVVGPVVV